MNDEDNEAIDQALDRYNEVIVILKSLVESFGDLSVEDGYLHVAWVAARTAIREVDLLNGGPVGARS